MATEPALIAKPLTNAIFLRAESAFLRLWPHARAVLDFQKMKRRARDHMA